MQASATTQAHLVLVLGVVRFSPVAMMKDYVPKIQDQLRRKGYPFFDVLQVPHFNISPAGVQVTHSEIPRFASTDGSWSVLLGVDAVVLQTGEYVGFSDFLERLLVIFDVVATTTELRPHGVLTKLGLRFINRFTGESDEQDARIHQHLRAVPESAFEPGTRTFSVESTGMTSLEPGPKGQLTVRVQRNRLGYALPLDLQPHAPTLRHSPVPGELTTLVDLDHQVDLQDVAETAHVRELLQSLHRRLKQTYADSVVIDPA